MISEVSTLLNIHKIDMWRMFLCWKHKWLNFFLFNIISIKYILISNLIIINPNCGHKILNYNLYEVESIISKKKKISFDFINFCIL